MKHSNVLPESPIDRLPKVLGADIELGNFLSGRNWDDKTGHTASRLLLNQIHGIKGYAYGGYQDYNPQDIGRKWLKNGSCMYIDLDHLEVCLPEVRSAWDFTASVEAQMRLVRQAMENASSNLQPGLGLHVHAANSDRCGSSWGSHINVLISKRCYNNIFFRRLDYLLWLASYQASSSVINGQGKVGAENGAPDVDYQLSQRADFLTFVVNLQTTVDRPLINSRCEALSADDPRCARFHHIANDMTLCPTATLLKVGVLQVLLAMVEAESPFIQPTAILQDPVGATTTISHDPDLNVEVQNLAGENLTAVAHQRRFYEAACQFVSAGGCDGVVPRAEEILDLWGSTLDLLDSKSWEPLSRRLDWVLKRRFLEEVLAANPELTWGSPEITRLDLLYSSLDDSEGIFTSLQAAGYVDQVVSEEQIVRFMTEPPDNTRAYTRAQLLRTFGQESIVDVDWDEVRIRQRPTRGSYVTSKSIWLGDPSRFGIDETGHLFERGGRASASDADILAALAVDSYQATTVPSNAFWVYDDTAGDAWRTQATTGGYLPPR